MTADVAQGPDARRDPNPRPNADILACVEQMEKIIAMTPLAILGVVVVLPTLATLFSNGLINAILAGLVLFFIAGVLIGLAHALVLNPLRNLRYKRAAAVLAGQVQALSEATSQWRSWWIGAPGALAITRNGHLVIVDRSTDYGHLWLDRRRIVNVSVEREATQITSTRHSGHVTFGASSSLFGAYTTGGRSRSTTTTVETAFLEIRYQMERNGAVYTSVIPFGADRRGADELCAAITRIEPAPV